MNNTIKDSRFFQGGHAIFTVNNSKGEHYTYRIGHSKENQPLCVGLLTGPDNETSYTYMGIFNPKTSCVVLTYASKYKEDSTPVKVVRWAITQVTKGNPLPTGYSIQHAGKCCCCGRTLTTPESVESGIGPICANKRGWGFDMKKQKSYSPFEDPPEYHESFA
jgi:hypothetical protein